ncbi:hypothetical protein [Rhodosalinus sp. 5P4]|uniref:hypothetical protein n=1 Tax=Rhodosalinus sp. 5P4 TaxID=3239196 RepID=UPI0035268ACD
MFEPSANVSEAFFRHLVQTHALGHRGFHGEDHWRRVLFNGRMLAAATGANLKVVELFALVHDSRRENEDHDPEHGLRAAHHARTLRETWFDASDDEMELLTEACRLHSDGLTAGDLTVRVCWDADRLDLGRVGLRPSARYLCTDHARRPEVIAAAYRRSLLGADA